MAGRRMDGTADARDDGRTVADMTGVGDGLRVSDLFGAHRSQRDVSGIPQRNVREELGDAEERMAVILGTLRAALAVGAVYVVVFGLFIALLLAVWHV